MQLMLCVRMPTTSQKLLDVSKLVMVFAPGARGDFLGRILQHDVDSTLADSICTSYQNLNFYKVHFLPNSELEIMGPVHNPIQYRTNQIEDMFDFFRKNNLYSVRVHSGFDPHSVIAWNQLSSIKHPIGFDFEFAWPRELTDRWLLDRYSAVVDFRDLWSVNQICNITKQITNNSLNNEQCAIIFKNIVQQPCVEYAKLFLTEKNLLPSVTHVNIPS